MQLNLKPTSAKVRDYYSALKQLGQLNISHEMAVRAAFASLLDSCARQFQWKLVPEYRIALPKNKAVIVDGAVLDTFTLRHGYWEAKDLQDDLEKEVKKKLDLGYPRSNIIFQSPERAILYQKGVRQGLNEDITDADNLVELLTEFFKYREPQHEEWESAVAEFSERIPEIAAAVKDLIDKERRKNQKFVAAFEGFVLLCRQAINPNLSDDAVEKMLIQHLLTERIFRKVFNNPEFTRRNIIAAEIEKVIDSLTSKHFSRDAFLHDLNRFYHAIEVNAENATDFSEKQTFLNTVYERFFQGFSKKEADTHGIVYTPQPIVNFMVRSVEEILKEEFGKSLSDREVHILDPFVGTGNFIVRVMQEIKKTALPYKYANELHCNEVMLLPYYIASMNIEHAYLEATTEYKAFEGICLVDTFEMAEAKQPELFTAANTARVEKQKSSPIFVVIGNPPYRASQKQEDENNRNRFYPALDQRISETYGEVSEASTVNKSRDPFVRAFRWASDRIGDEGIVCLVTNSSYLDQVASDGIRKSLTSEYGRIYLLDLGGNVRKNPAISGTTHNVFGIKLGVCIALFVRNRSSQNTATEIFYATINDHWRKEERLRFLEEHATNSVVQWQRLHPDDDGNWLTGSLKPEYSHFISIANQETKSGRSDNAIFKDFSLGANTNRDEWVYDFDQDQLTKRIKKLSATYNSEVHRFLTSSKPANLDEFVLNDPKRIQWSSRLKETLRAGKLSDPKTADLRYALYRPYTTMFLQFDPILIHRRGRLPVFFPRAASESENMLICATGVGAERPFASSATRIIPDLNFYGPGTVPQWFPFYTYSQDGTNRRENITDWALEQFRSHYKDKSITKWDIFYYTYAVLHHPEYRARYAANLKRELPRIPYAPDFHSFAKAGKRLAELHVDYEKQKPYPLEQREKPGAALDLRVEKMRLSKDKQTLAYNGFLTLTGIPKETYDYRLGNRSALEWVIDQYQVSTDKRSGITNDPNRPDDPEYILRLIGQVITVSLETVKIVNALPDLGLPKSENELTAKTVQ